jgi:hypothetical protein
MLKSYRASCHCGKVVVLADLDLTQPSYRCNCSICRRNRFWAAITKADGFKLVMGEPELTKYLFGSEKGQHFFCKHCGVRVFGIGPDMYGINIGCLEGVTEEQLSQIPITYVDGMNDRWNKMPTFWRHL